MLDSPVPAYVDTRKIFQQQVTIKGSIGLERLNRFQQILASDKGWIEVELRFSLDSSRRRVVEGHLQAQVQVYCQRCLEPLAIELCDDIRLALLKDEAGSKDLDDSLDPWICEDHKLDLVCLVEEQLILCMPIANYHASRDCSERLNYSRPAGASLDNEQDRRKENPFSILNSLKEND